MFDKVIGFVPFVFVLWNIGFLVDSPPPPGREVSLGAAAVFWLIMRSWLEVGPSEESPWKPWTSGGESSWLLRRLTRGESSSSYIFINA